MIHLLDISDMNHRLAVRRRNDAARRALTVAAYCLAAVSLGVLIGRLAAFYL